MRSPWIVLMAGTATALGSARLPAQTLRSAIDQAGADTSVRFSYPPRPGVCGGGDGSITIQDEGGIGTVSIYHADGGYSMHAAGSASREWVGECAAGPVRVSLDRRGGKVRGVRVYVGGQWAAAAAAGLDLGTVAPGEASAYLLATVSPEAPSRMAHNAILAAVIARNARPWPALFRIARAESYPRAIRNTAATWLGRAAASRLTASLHGRISDASDLEVRKQAVFALSQRPREEAIPALLQVAQTSSEPALRRAAIFWLAQSGDPRALDLFARILGS